MSASPFRSPHGCAASFKRATSASSAEILSSMRLENTFFAALLFTLQSSLQQNSAKRIEHLAWTRRPRIWRLWLDRRFVGVMAASLLAPLLMVGSAHAR